MTTIQHYKTTVEITEFMARLVAEGYTRVGSGYWSVVFGKDKFVCKVGEAKSKGYLSFVRQAIKHPENPHLPKIYAAGIFHVGNRPYFVVHMERLTPTRSMNSAVVDKWFEEHNLDDSWDFDYLHVVKKCSKTKALKELADILAKLYKKYDEDMADFNLMWRTRGVKQPELVIIDPVWK